MERFMFMKIILTPGGCLPLPRGYIHVYDHNILTYSFSETALPIKAKLYVEHHQVGGMKLCIQGQGHMTKMATIAIYMYSKNF